MLRLEGEVKMKKLFLIALLSLMAATCGGKNELTKPDGNATPNFLFVLLCPPNPIGR